MTAISPPRRMHVVPPTPISSVQLTPDVEFYKRGKVTVIGSQYRRLCRRPASAFTSAGYELGKLVSTVSLAPQSAKSAAEVAAIDLSFKSLRS